MLLATSQIFRHTFYVPNPRGPLYVPIVSLAELVLGAPGNAEPQLGERGKK